MSRKKPGVKERRNPNKKKEEEVVVYTMWNLWPIRDWNWIYFKAQPSIILFYIFYFHFSVLISGLENENFIVPEPGKIIPTGITQTTITNKAWGNRSSPTLSRGYLALTNSEDRVSLVFNGGMLKLLVAFQCTWNPNLCIIYFGALR